MKKLSITQYEDKYSVEKGDLIPVCVRMGYNGDSVCAIEKDEIGYYELYGKKNDVWLVNIGKENGHEGESSPNDFNIGSYKDSSAWWISDEDYCLWNLPPLKNKKTFNKIKSLLQK